MKPIIWSDHARLKLTLLSQHGLTIEGSIVENVLRQPARIEAGRSGRLIAQGELDAARVLRIVYEDAADCITIVTLYPGRRSRYA